MGAGSSSFYNYSWSEEEHESGMEGRSSLQVGESLRDGGRTKGKEDSSFKRKSLEEE
jgi:hypothetical protein